MFSDRHVYPRLQQFFLSHIHSMNPNCIKECIRIVRGHNKHENVIAIWDEPIRKVQS